jgi:hypothetical protein
MLLPCALVENEQLTSQADFVQLHWSACVAG